jgi:uncharacterized protein YpuA (DUF1002 family)
MKFMKLCILICVIAPLYAQDLPKGSLSSQSNGWGSDAGKNTALLLLQNSDKVKDITDTVGITTATLLISSCSAGYAKLGMTATAFKAGMSIGALTAKASTAAATAFAIVTSPYTIGGAASVAVGYGGYKAYKHYYPTEQEKAAAQAETASLLKLAEQHKAETETFRRQALAMQRERELLERRTEFGGCMTRNMRGSIGSMGVPSACESSAAALAFMGQYTEVEQASQFLKKYRD